MSTITSQFNNSFENLDGPAILVSSQNPSTGFKLPICSDNDAINQYLAINCLGSVSTTYGHNRQQLTKKESRKRLKNTS